MECRICLEDIEESELYLNLECNHTFHYECLEKMTNNLCPLCRKDNKDLFVNNGIEIENENDEIASSIAYDDLDDDYEWNNDYRYSARRRNHEMQCERTIDALTRGSNYGSSFISCIKNLDILFDTNMLARANKLYGELEKHNLTIRSDSTRCIDYIKDVRNALALNEVVNSMLEMEWFFKYTDYSGRMANYNSRDKFERSRYAKDYVIKDYVKTPEKYSVAPPNVPQINKIVTKYESFYRTENIIRKWDGNLSVDLYTLVKKEDLGDEHNNLVRSYLWKYAEEYAAKNYKLFMECNMEKKIAELLEKEIKFYLEIKNVVKTPLYNKMKEHMDEYCKKLNYRYDSNWYQSYNDYCCGIIEKYVNVEIAKKYKKPKVIKFMSIENDEWKSHMRGCSLFKDALCDYIDQMISNNMEEYIKSNSMYYKEDIKSTETEYVKEKLENILDDYVIRNKKYCIEKIFRSNIAKIKKMKLEEKVDFFIKSNKCTPDELKNITIEIFDWCLINIAEDIENENHLNFLCKIDLCKLHKELTCRLRKRPYFSKVLPQIKCPHMPSPYCSNNACRHCCDSKCTHHGNK